MIRVLVAVISGLIIARVSALAFSVSNAVKTGAAIDAGATALKAMEQAALAVLCAYVLLGPPRRR